MSHSHPDWLPTGLGAILAVLVLVACVIAILVPGVPDWLVVAMIAALAVARLT